MFHNLTTYPHLRNTCLPWAPRIPSHWTLARAKSLMRAVDIRSSSGTEELLTVSSSRGVVPRSSVAVSMFQAASYIGHKLCWPDDLVINSLWAWGRGLGVATHHGIVSTAYGVYRPIHNASLNPRYLHLLVRSEPFNWELQVRSQGIWKSRLQLTDERWLDTPLLVPPPDEQEAIVTYLAHADGRVGSAIAAKRRLISLLEEQKRSVIAYTMASIEDGDRELRHVLRSLVDCEHKTAPFVEGGQWWVLRTSAVKAGAIEWNGAYTTDEASYRAWTARATPEPGDVIFTREAPVGEAAVIPEDRPVALGQRTVLMKVRPTVIDPDFLVSQIYGGLPRERIAIATQGSTVGHFNMDDIGWMRVAVPSIARQREVVQEIAAANATANAAIDRASSEIALLQEFRARLIADIVTGQLDVREAAAALPDVEPSAGWADSYASDEELEEELDDSGEWSED